MDNIFFCDFIYSFLLTSEAERPGGARSRDMAYSNVGPIPLFKEQGQQNTYSEKSGSGQERRPPKNTKAFSPAFEKRDTPGRGLGGLTPNL